MGESSKLVPSPRGFQKLTSTWFIATPFGRYVNPKRCTGLAAVLAASVNAGTIASNNGNATVAPMPRRNVRRANAFFVMIMVVASPPLARLPGAWPPLVSSETDGSSPHRG